MREEQERGRVTAIRNRRMKAVANALVLVPALERAGSELRNPTLRNIADWLNARDYKTSKGKVWRAQTVSNLLSVDDLLVRDAEAEFKRELEIERELSRRRIGYGQDRKVVEAQFAEKYAELKKRFIESKKQAFEIRDQIRPLIKKPER